MATCDKKNGYLYSCTVGDTPVTNHMLTCTAPGPSGQITPTLEAEVHAHAQNKLGKTDKTGCD